MAIFDVLKSAAMVAKEAGKIELYGQILEAQEKLLEQHKKILELEEENKSLKDILNQKKNLIHQAEVYYLLREDGEKDGPFCAKCQDTDGLLVRMVYWNEKRKRCPNCGKNYAVV